MTIDYNKFYYDTSLQVFFPPPSLLLSAPTTPVVVPVVIFSLFLWMRAEIVGSRVHSCHSSRRGGVCDASGESSREGKEDMAHRSRLQELISGQVSLERMAEMMAPKLVDGRWRKPELSRRLVAKVRKAWLQDGKDWPFEQKERTNYGGWAIKDLPEVKMKGKKVDRQKVDR